MKKSPAAFSLVISCSSRLPEISLILQETALLLKGMHFNFSADFFFFLRQWVTVYIATGRIDFSAVVPGCFTVAVRYETMEEASCAASFVVTFLWKRLADRSISRVFLLERFSGLLANSLWSGFPNVFLVWFRHLFASFLLHVRHSGRDYWLGLTQWTKPNIKKK